MSFKVSENKALSETLNCFILKLKLFLRDISFCKTVHFVSNRRNNSFCGLYILLLLSDKNKISIKLGLVPILK